MKNGTDHDKMKKKQIQHVCSISQKHLFEKKTSSSNII